MCTDISTFPYYNDSPRTTNESNAIHRAIRDNMPRDLLLDAAAWLVSCFAVGSVFFLLLFLFASSTCTFAHLFMRIAPSACHTYRVVATTAAMTATTITLCTFKLFQHIISFFAFDSVSVWRECVNCARRQVQAINSQIYTFRMHAWQWQPNQQAMNPMDA